MITKITRNGIKGAMFVTIFPFLVIDDNTIKTSNSRKAPLCVNQNMEDAKPIKTPMAPNGHLVTNIAPFMPFRVILVIE